MPAGPGKYLVTEPTKRDLEAMLRWWKSTPQSRVARRARPLPDTGGQRWLAKIVAWLALGSTGARWKYGHHAVGIDDNDAVIELDGPEGTVTEGYALNIIEANNVALNTGTQGTSVKESRQAYIDSGFQIQPVGGGTSGVPANEVVVWMSSAMRSDGSTLYLFQYENSHDGDC